MMLKAGITNWTRRPRKVNYPSIFFFVYYMMKPNKSPSKSDLSVRQGWPIVKEQSTAANNLQSSNTGKTTSITPKHHHSFLKHVPTWFQYPAKWCVAAVKNIKQASPFQDHTSTKRKFNILILFTKVQNVKKVHLQIRLVWPSTRPVWLYIKPVLLGRYGIRPVWLYTPSPHPILYVVNNSLLTLERDHHLAYISDWQSGSMGMYAVAELGI